MPRKTSWPEHELETVCRMFPRATDLEIGETLHRSESVVRVMRYAVGLRRDLRHLWTAQEIATLKAMFIEGHTDIEIAQAVGHTRLAVLTRRLHLGLKRQRVYRKWGYAFMDRQTHPARNGLTAQGRVRPGVK
jgi:hypothetical protein